MLVDDILRTRTSELKRKSNEKLLQEVIMEYKKHRLFARWLGSVFAYVDRQYADPLKLLPLREMTLKSFPLVVISSLSESLKSILMNIVSRDRNYSLEPEILESLKDFIECLEEMDPTLNLYRKIFEEQFMVQSVIFFKDQLDISPPPTVLNEIFEKEQNRVQKYIHASTEVRLMNQCSSILLKKPYKPSK